MATQQQIIAREYRNRRICDFLKELHLTEARGTGFPRIYNAMTNNGSPKPIFETDEATYVLVTIPIHDDFKVEYGKLSIEQLKKKASQLKIKSLKEVIILCNQVSNQVSNHVSKQVSNQVSNIVEEEISKHVGAILSMLRDTPLSSTEILLAIGLTKQTKNKKKHIDPLIDIGWLAYTIPENIKDRNQKYRITEQGKNLLSILKATST